VSRLSPSFLMPGVKINTNARLPHHRNLHPTDEMEIAKLLVLHTKQIRLCLP